MVFNLPETTDNSKEADFDKLKELLNYVNSEVEVDYLTTDNFARLGKYDMSNQRPRPIKLEFNDPDSKWKFLKKASNLRNSKVFSKVGLSLDKTTKERKEDMALRDKLKAEREMRPSEHLVIFRKEVWSKTEISEFKKGKRNLPAAAARGVASGHGGDN